MKVVIPHKGVVMGAREDKDGFLWLILSDDEEVLWATLQEIRTATSSEKKAAQEEWEIKHPPETDQPSGG